MSQFGIVKEVHLCLALPMPDLHHQFWVQMVINVSDHDNDVQRGQCMMVYQNQLEDFEGRQLSVSADGCVLILHLGSI